MDESVSVQALRESEELHRITLSNVSDAVFITDDEGVFTFICPNVDVIFGYGMDDVRTMGRIARLLGGDLVDREGLAASGEMRNIEHDIVNKAGSRRSLLVHIKRVSIKGGTILYVCRDITERKAAEEVLRQNEERLTLALAAAHLGTWDWHVPSGAVSWSDETRRIFGLTTGASPPSLQSLLELLHPADRARFSQAMTNALEQDTPFDLEFRVIDREGVEHWVMGKGKALKDAAGHPIRVLGVNLDITLRKQAEQDLHQQLRFEALISSLSARFAALHDADVARAIEPSLRALGEFLSVDRAELWELTADGQAFAVMGSWQADGVPAAPPLVPLERVPAINATLVRGMTFSYGRVEELPLHASAERAFAVAEELRSLLVIPISLGGSLLGALSFGQLRSERAWPSLLVKQMHLVAEMFGTALARQRSAAAMAAARIELLHASRLSIVGELTAAVAHEIRQPLSSIAINASAALGMLDTGSGLDELREILRDIRDENTRANDVITRLGALLRKRKLELYPLDVNNVVSDVLRLVRADASQRHVALEPEQSPDLPLVQGDKVYLQQVLLNLIFNAMDAMAETAPSARRLVIRTSRAEEGDILVVVADSGPGIASDAAPRLFEAFFTTKKDGMGLGLSIARSIVEAHGGRIRAENAPAGGATLCLTLPALA